MKQEVSKIKSFKDLIAWQKAHELVLVIYEITKKFTKEEVFGLTNQMRCSAVSITSNLAEGFNRQSKKEKVQFYFTSLGSLGELQSQLLISKDIGYITNEEFKKIDALTIDVQRLIKSTKKFLTS